MPICATRAHSSRRRSGPSRLDSGRRGKAGLHRHQCHFTCRAAWEKNDRRCRRTNVGNNTPDRGQPAWFSSILDCSGKFAHTLCLPFEVKPQSMTRVNLVPPKELSRQHLIAEYRELPRIFKLAEKAAKRNDKPRVGSYTLGKGHCRFFYTRLQFLIDRQALLVQEMRRRGYQVNFPPPVKSDFDIPEHWFGEWEPDDNAIEINRARIGARRSSEDP